MRTLNKILLIDYDEVDNFINEELLRSLSISKWIEVLSDGRQGLVHLLKSCEFPDEICPNLVVFNHQIPNMDGLEMIRALEAIGFMKERKIVFLLLGNYSTEEEITFFKNLGVQVVTTKPLSKETVMYACKKYWSLVN